MRFFLDECLPHRVADALALVDYPITTPPREGKRGWKDPDLLPWRAKEEYVWITKDDKARRQHGPTILKHRLSVAWVRGLDRSQGGFTVQDLHLMLTVKLQAIEEELLKTRSHRWFLLYLKAPHSPALKIENPEETTRQSSRAGKRA